MERLEKPNLKVEGEARDIAMIKNQNGNYLLFLRNNNYPKLFRINANRKK